MTRIPHWQLGLWLAAGLALAVCGAAWSAWQPAPGTPAAAKKDETPEEPDPELPKLEDKEKQIPTMETLLRDPPRDWLVVKPGDRVIEVQPLFPRPNTLEQMDEIIKEAVRRRGPKSKDEEAEAEFQRLFYIEVRLLDGDEREFRLHRDRVSKIVYHEDVMLRRVDLLLDERLTTLAFELLTAVEHRHPGWAGIKPRQERLLLVEAEVRAEKRRFEEALAWLEDLHQQNPQFPGQGRVADRVCDELVAAAVSDSDFRRARHFLERSRRRWPDAASVLRWTDELKRQAAAALDRAVGAESAAAYETAAAEADLAARIWPRGPADWDTRLIETHRRIGRRYPRLTVAVVDEPLAGAGRVPQGEAEPAAARLRGSADLRIDRLQSMRLFTPGWLDGKTVRYRSSMLRDWEPTELGRTWRLMLDPSAGGTSANELAAAIRGRIDPADARFDARIRQYVRRITVESPSVLSLDFERVPLRPEALFSGPLDEGAPAQVRQRFALVKTLPRARTTAGTGAGPAVAEARPRGEAAGPLLSAASDAANGSADPPTPLPGTEPGGLAARFHPGAIPPPALDEKVYRRRVPDEPVSGTWHVAEVRERRYARYEEAIQGLLRGEVLMLVGLRPWEVASLQSVPQLKAYEFALPTTHVLQFHPAQPVLAGRTLRRALASALDREALLQQLVLRGADPRWARTTTGIVPSRSYAYNVAVKPVGYDRALARTLVEAAKLELKKDLPVLRLAVPATPWGREIGAELIKAWKAAGIPCEVAPEPASHLDAPANWDIVLNEVRILEPLTEIWPALTMRRYGRIEHLSRAPTWLRQELIALDRSADWATAEERLRRVHELVAADLFVIPLWEYSEFLVARDAVQGIPQRPLHPYDAVENWQVQPWFPRETP